MASTTCPSSTTNGRRGCSACARRRVRRAGRSGSVSGSDARPPEIGAGCCSSARARPAESLLGKSRPAGENAAPAEGRLQHTRALRERVDRGGCAVAFEVEDDLALADEDVVPLESQALNVEGRALLDEPPGRLGRAPPDRNNHRNARPRRPLGPEAREQIGELAEQAHPAQGGDEHPLARVPLEDERLVAVDPFTGSAPDLHRGELVERDSEPIGFTRPVQDEVVVAELQPAAGGRASAGAPDDGVLVRTTANTLGGHDCSFLLGEAIAPTASWDVRERCNLGAAKY